MVEPVFGSLLNYFGMKKASARGKDAAHKITLAAASAYNLHKLAAFLGYPKATTQRLPLAQTNSLSLLSLLVVPQPRTLKVTVLQYDYLSFIAIILLIDYQLSLQQLP
jgi:hypothetical protein